MGKTFIYVWQNVLFNIQHLKTVNFKSPHTAGLVAGLTSGRGGREEYLKFLKLYNTAPYSQHVNNSIQHNSIYSISYLCRRWNQHQDHGTPQWPLYLP
jgi:hypothetical protein